MFFMVTALTWGVLIALQPFGGYVLVAGGFCMLLLFCFLRGHSADVETPENDLRDMEKGHDRQRSPEQAHDEAAVRGLRPEDKFARGEALGARPETPAAPVKR